MALVLNGSGVITGVTDLATAGVTLDDAALTDPVVTGGVYLGGTGAGNYLDDYEEGTWSPTVEAYTGTDPTVSYGTRAGAYTKIGRFVHISCEFTVTGITGTTSGLFALSGLPFTVDQSSAGAGITGAFSAENITLARTAIGAFSRLGSVGLGILSSNNGGAWNWETCNIFTTNSTFRMSATYYTS